MITYVRLFCTRLYITLPPMVPMDKEESRETFSPRWIATLKIGRRCPLAHHLNTSATSRTQYATQYRKQETEREQELMNESLTASDYEVPGPGQHRVEIEE